MLFLGERYIDFEIVGLAPGYKILETNMWELVSKKMERRMASWKRKFLTGHGRLTPIKNI